MATTDNNPGSSMGAFTEGFIQLPAVRQMGVLIGFAAVAALGVVLVIWSMTPSYGVLFGSLGDKEAAEITELLRSRNIDYKLDERTGALLVPSSKVQELRMQLAAEGLPKSSSMGLEILQQKSEFGTSQFMETTRYQHALEQELARSIMSLSNVEGARVHLALPKQSVFVRKRQPPSASVLLNLYSGRMLEAEQVGAIQHLVASGIPNLEASQVTVVDESGRLLSSKKRSTEMAQNQDQFEYTRNIEQSYIDRIEDILAPIVGRNGMRAQVSAELDFTVTEQTQESFNPDLPALRSEQISEEQMLGEALQGVPGALSNQPPGAASVPEDATAGAEGEAERQKLNSRLNSTKNYELDRTISHSRLASGSIKRLSIAVVVDERLTTGDKGEAVREPRSAEEMERLSSLVREAVGYNAARGDSVNVINAAFAVAELVGELPEQPIYEQTWVLDIAKIAGALLLGILLIFMVLRPMMRNLAAVSEPMPLAAGAAGAAGGMGLEEDQLSLSGGEKEGLIKLAGPGAYEDNIGMVQQVVKDDPKLVAQVVRNWISEDK